MDSTIREVRNISSETAISMLHKESIQFAKNQSAGVKLRVWSATSTMLGGLSSITEAAKSPKCLRDRAVGLKATADEKVAEASEAGAKARLKGRFAKFVRKQCVKAAVIAQTLSTLGGSPSPSEAHTPSLFKEASELTCSPACISVPSFSSLSAFSDGTRSDSLSLLRPISLTDFINLQGFETPMDSAYSSLPAYEGLTSPPSLSNKTLTWMTKRLAVTVKDEAETSLEERVVESASEVLRPVFDEDSQSVAADIKTLVSIKADRVKTYIYGVFDKIADDITARG